MIQIQTLFDGVLLLLVIMNIIMGIANKNWAAVGGWVVAFMELIRRLFLTKQK